MRAIILLACMLAATVRAAPPRYTRSSTLDPKLSEHVRAAEQAWRAADTEQDAAKQSARWEDAAAAFALIDGDPVDAKIKREAAYAALLAWKNALRADATVVDAPRTSDAPTPRPLPAREQRLIAAIDRYAKYATGANDTELPSALFIKARTLAQFDQHETAIPIYRDLIARFPRHDISEYAANLLFDTYHRLGQHDKLVALADELATNKGFLRDREDLARLVNRIQQQFKRNAAERLEAEAKRTNDPEKYVAAGNVYLELYNADPRNPAGDELLYNAGVELESGRAITAAIAAFELIQKRYPNSKLTQRALARLGTMYGSMAIYDKAADKLEEYAKKYAGEKDAYAAMSDAIYYRTAMGDRAKAIENTKYFVRTFGAKKPRDAANAMWSLAALHEPAPALVISHLQQYLRTYGAEGGAERLVIAHAKVGLLLWTQSCKVSGRLGLCARPNDRAPRACGKGTTRALTAVARDPRKTKEAMAAFAMAIKEYERHQPSEDAVARYHYAQVKLAMADLELERYLTLELPRGLDFDPARRETREASMKRFSAWLADKERAGAAARRQYDSVLAIKDTASSITAIERRAIITQSFATSLLVGELPRDVRAANQIEAYCRAMTDVVEPLEATAITEFGVCLAKSTELGWFGESSAHCERELIQLKPDEYPAANELRSAAMHDALVIAAEPPVR